MTASPRLEDQVLVTYEVTSDGAPIPDSAFVKEVETESELNRIPFATITLVDGDRSTEEFEWSASDQFLPGAAIRIEAGYHSETDLIFEGIVLRHGLRVDPGGRSYLVLTCADKAIGLTVGRASAQYLEMSDAEILSDIIGAAGCSADVPASDLRPEATVRHEATDWDFILLRATALGRSVKVAGGKVTVAAPEFPAPDVEVRFGEAIDVLELDLDAGAQILPPEAGTWDPSAQDVVTATAAEPSLNSQGNLDGPVLAAAVGNPDSSLRSVAAQDAEGVQTWADARLIAARLARIRGRLAIPGTAKLAPGGTVGLAGLGPRFDGTAYVSGVKHVLRSGEWRTEIRIGLDPLRRPDRLPEIDGPPAGGLRPAATGLQIAKVKQIHEDPKAERRVKVTLPLAEEQSDGIWVRLLCSYATEDAGTVFLPEPGDEVVLGFLDDDPQSAILLGALQSSARPAPYEPEADNRIKAIVTRQQIKIEMDDTDKILTISTPGGQIVTLSDKDTQVRLEDATGNSVDLSPSGIAVESPGDITIKATGKVQIEGTTGITATSPADVGIKGLNASVEGDVGVTAKGGASAELSAGAQTIVKGAVVMIN
ncbi:MAG: type VI secretion system tip protein VgrG [Pseudomonadota bacterium]